MLYDVRVRLLAGDIVVEQVDAENEDDAILRAGANLADKGRRPTEYLGLRSEEDYLYDVP